MGKRKISALVILAAWLAAGCGKDHTGVTFDKRFSINVARPDVDWPGNPRKMLSQAQQQVFEIRGRPAFIRFWWDGRDDFSELNEVERSEVNILSVPNTWIYGREGDEILFPNAGTYESRPIGDRLALILQDGDPYERRFDTGPGGEEIEVWHYLSTGYEYRFRDGKLISKKRLHDPVGGRGSVLLR